MPRMSALQRFMKRVINLPSGCWELKSKDESSRYLPIWDGRLTPASRFIYEKMVGKIPEGLEIDHLCRNTRCVNPKHLQPVSHHTNILRGKLGILGHFNKAKTHCPHGHQYTKENTYIYRETLGGLGRMCRTCVRLRQRRLNKKRGGRREPSPSMGIPYKWLEINPVKAGDISGVRSSF